MADTWRFIPNQVLDDEERKVAAEEWETKHRQQLAVDFALRHQKVPTFTPTGMDGPPQSSTPSVQLPQVPATPDISATDVTGGKTLSSDISLPIGGEPLGWFTGGAKDIVELPGRPLSTINTGLAYPYEHNMQTSGQVSAMADALMGRTPFKTGASVLAATHPEWPELARNVVGMASDITIDPLNVPLGAGLPQMYRLGKGAVELGGKAATAARPLASSLLEAAKNPALGRMLPAATLQDVGKSATKYVPKPGFAGNIKLEKFPEELRPDIQNTYNANPEMFDAARRGVRSDAQVRSDASALIDSVGGNGEKSVNRWKEGQAWNAEEVVALKEVLANRTKSVLTAQKDMLSSGDSTANLVKLQLAVEEQRAAQKAVTGVTAEVGRSLRAMRQTITGALEANDEKALREILERMGGRQTTEELASAISKIDLNDQEAVYKLIRNSQPHPSYITEVFYNSILSNPGTHARNMIGNTLAALLTPVEGAVAAVIDRPLAAISGRPRGRFLGEVTPSVFGAVRSIPEGVSKALYILKNGHGWDDVAQMELRRPEAFKGKVGAVINQPTRALIAADTIFRSMHYSAAINAGAYRMARMEGLKGDALTARIAEELANPSKELLEYAGKMSKYRVYQQPPGQFAQGLTKIQNINLGVGGRNIQPVRFILPFIPTPINLAKYGLERSPLGILNPKLWTNIINKDPEAADQLARWFIGSTITSAMVAYAADGKITGAAPESSVERDRFFREGKQAYSVRVGDRWVPYNSAEPLNQPLAIASVVVDAMKGGKDVGSMLGAAVGGVAKNVVSQRYMSGVSDFMNVLESPERYSGDIIERGIVSLGVPFSSLSRGIAQTIDPTFRQSQGLGEEFKKILPGMSQQLPPKLNAFGEQSQRETSPLGPVLVTTAKSDPVNDELVRLDVNVGFVGNSISGVPLSREQKQSYQELSGKVVKSLLDSTVSNTKYQQLSDADKRTALEDINRRGKALASQKFLDQMVEQRLRERAGVK